MNPNLLKQVIVEQRKILLPPDLFEREVIRYIKPAEKTNDIVILSGIRRSGKSTLMHQIRTSDYAINFDDERLENFQLSDFQTLCEVFIELFGVQHQFYFDEIQNISGWEKFIRRLHNQGEKVYITGSNALLFSQELGTRLTGRYTQIEMFPYSFKEFIAHYFPEALNTQVYTTEQKGLALKYFNEYLEFGGLPEYIRFKEKSHIQMLYENILYRDIIARYRLSSDVPIKTLVLLLASHVGKEFSFSEAAKYIGISSATTVADYCSYLQGSYLCFVINRYSHSINKQILSNKKCYFIDHALARVVGFRPTEDRGRLFENLIFLELKRRREEIFFHKESRECDFITRKEGRIHRAIQVCIELSSPKTRAREIEGILEAMESYQLPEGFIVTENTEETLIVPQGKITIVPAWKWLLSA